MTTVYVDLDGVLANFNKAASSTFGVAYPKRTRLSHTWLQDETGVTAGRWFELVKGDPAVWDRIEPYPWTTDIVQCLDVYAPGWKILSVAMHDPPCWSAKARWVSNHLWPIINLHRLILVGGRKYELVRPGDVLIDDWDENIDQWIRLGGVGFKWNEFTDDMPDVAAAQLVTLKNFLHSQNRLHQS